MAISVEAKKPSSAAKRHGEPELIQFKLLYVICFTLLYRLFRSGLPSTVHVVALWFLGSLLLVNAGWNYFFFRRRDLWASLLLNIPYAVIAATLATMLVQMGDGSIWVFAPYLVYLAGTWSF